MPTAVSTSEFPPVRTGWRRWRDGCGVAVLYAATALLSRWLTVEETFEASFWLPGGLMLGLLLTSARGDWWWLILAGLVGDRAYDLVGEPWSWFNWAAVSAGNMVSALVAAVLIQRWVVRRPALRDVRELCGVTLLAGLGLVISSLVGAWAITRMSSQADFVGVAWSWYTSDLLGVILMTPVVLVWRPWPLRWERSERMVEGFALIAGLWLAITGVIVFHWIAGPGLRYVVFPFVIWASIRFGPRGISVVSLVVALLLGWFALNGFASGIAPLATAGARNGQVQLGLTLLGFFGLIPAIVIEAHGRTMAELRLQRNFHQAIFDSEPECLQVLGPDGELRELNRAGLALFEVASVEEAREQGVLAFILPPYRTGFVAAMQAALTGTSTVYLYEIEGRRGARRWLESQAAPVRDGDGQASGLLVATRDVTERKQTEEALRRARFTVDKATVAMLWVNEAAEIVDVNQAAADLLGYTMDELRQQRLAGIDVEFDEVRWPQHWAELRRNQSESFTSRQQRRDGREIQVQVSVHFLNLGGSELSCAFVQDVTAQREAEVLRRKNEEQLSLIFSAVGDGIVLLDQHLSIVQCNKAAERILGRTAEQILGRSTVGQIWQAVAEDGRVIAPADQPAAVALRTATGVRDVVMGLRRPDRPLLWISISAEPLCDESGAVTMVVCSFNDITASRTLQEKVRQAQKMEVVGQLAGGVAHDFNNILTVMSLNLQLVEMTEALPAELQQPITELRAMTGRAAKLTAQLLLFARQSVMQKARLDLNEAATSLVTMLRRILGEQIQIERQRGAEALWIDGDAGMIDQVVMNLCVNARDAMPQGGLLTISTERFHRPAAVGQPDAKVGWFARLGVRDTGHGMSPEVMAHLFEPFFTTKEVGKGTGLGLATVHGIVEEHQGWIEVESQAGEGTTFWVFLPLIDLPEADPPTGPGVGPGVAVLPPEGAAASAATILLVEDEAPVRTVAAMMLRRLGYRVLEADGGAQAVAIWAKRGTEISLLITDMVMPGNLSGLQLIALLRESRSDLGAVIMSGYSHEILEQESLAESGVLFMGKPFEFDEMAATVRRGLGLAE